MDDSLPSEDRGGTGFVGRVDENRMDTRDTSHDDADHDVGRRGRHRNATCGGLLVTVGRG